MKKEFRLEYLTPSELDLRLKEKSILYFPIGSVEWHNEHLPLGTDTFHAFEISKRLCEKIGGVLLPPFWWNTGGCHRSSSTYYMSECHYLSVLKIICTGFKDIKARMIVLVNGHGGKYQHDSMEVLAHDFNVEKSFPMKMVVADPYHLGKSSPCRIDHADTGETSFSMELIPHLVKIERKCFPDLYSGNMPFEKGQPSKNGGKLLWEAFEKDAVALIDKEYAEFI